MLTETLLKFPSLGLVDVLECRPLIGCRENELVTGGFQYYFKESQAASCKHFQCQYCRFRVFEAGYWKDFQNY
jgi:hypothetical protein